MHLLYHDLVMDLERERSSKHGDARYAALAAMQNPDGSSVRRRLAVVLAGVSRASAAGVRRLDACLADDLVARVAANR
ncbi:MAG: hypothetical protein K0S97_914 [Chloroflexota bacterium]|jgi:hypothetical protein|nr:hypothetical protein [Chloroflexota bacterium]